VFSTKSLMMSTISCAGVCFSAKMRLFSTAPERGCGGGSFVGEHAHSEQAVITNTRIAGAAPGTTTDLNAPA
jgi:hypothetical protein